VKAGGPVGEVKARTSPEARAVGLLGVRGVPLRKVPPGCGRKRRARERETEGVRGVGEVR
jgi:hypothetical protein